MLKVHGVQCVGSLYMLHKSTNLLLAQRLEGCIGTLSRWVLVGVGNFNSAVGERERGSGEKNNKNAGLRIPQQCIKRHKKAK